jgi:hypothetical protein
MNPPSPAIRNLARWLLARESAAVKPPGGTSPGVFFVCDTLRQHLSVLAGAAGFRSLISRALTLARAEVPGLDAVRVREDGSLEWPGADESQRDPEGIAKGEAALVARFLGLLISFIGEPLTLRLVREVWPDAPFCGTDAGAEEDA